MNLYCETRGSGSPTFLLLHGMSANGAVWEPFARLLAAKYPGKILIPDLRGHGRSPHGTHYGYGQHAADVAELLGREERAYVIGHSMGGAVGLALASGWFGVRIEGLLAFSTKVGFSADELSRLQQLAQAPVRWFDSQSEATARFLKVAGLEGLMNADSAAARAGVREEGGRYRLAADPAHLSVTTGPALETLLANARTRVVLACGANDRMVPTADLRALAPDAVELPGLGHNLHVEDPHALLKVMENRLLPSTGAQ